MTKSKSHNRNPIRHINYPAGVKEISQDLPKDELVRRLKMLARSFQDMEQEEDNSKYESLAIHITDNYFLKHASKDVGLLVACCVADVFRIFAPEAPYRTADQLKTIFKFLCEQLWDLEDTTSPSWKRYFYLLENLAMVKSFNICMELGDANEIFVRLFTIFFSIVNKNHPPKVRGFMLDVMCPLISENDSVSPDLLEVILKYLVESKKAENPFATVLAKDLIKRTATSIEPAMQTYFNNAIVLGKSSESELSRYTYELIYQLNLISNNLLLAVLPQLEFKLKTSEEKERLSVTKLLGRMFSDKESDLAATNKPLWHCFLGRFSDITAAIRIECVKFVPMLLASHPYLVEDLADRLRERAHDVEDDVRLETVQSLVSAAKKDITVVSHEMLQLVKERTLDKKWKIRKEAILGLAHIYKKWCHSDDIAEKDKDRLLWIKDKILHSYYLQDLDDRLLVERIFTMNLVPYTLPVTERMKRFLELFVTVDEHSVKAIIELIKCQHIVRTHLRDLLEALRTQTDGEQNKTVFTKIVAIAKSLPENSKTQEHLKKMVKLLKEDERLMASMVLVVSHDVTCKKSAHAVGEIMKKFASSKPSTTGVTHHQPIYNTIKTLMERVSPLIQDGEATQEFLGILSSYVDGEGPQIRGARQREVVEKGLRLIQVLAHVYPYTFKSEESLGYLVAMAKNEDSPEVAETALRTLTQVGIPYEDLHPAAVKDLCKLLIHFATSGSRKQAKHSIRCINCVCTTSKKEILDTVFKKSQENLSLDHEQYYTALTAVAHIARLAPQQFLGPMKAIIAGTIVKEILMKDHTEGSKAKGIWCLDEHVCEETQGKLLAMKVLVHWLLGLGRNISGSVISTVRLLTTMLKNEGDLMERKKTGRADMSRLRLGAGCALLKLAQEPAFAEFISLEQFQLIALLINDECFQVREIFAEKLNQGLTSLRLPLSYMGILSLCAKDPVKDNQKKAVGYIKQCVAVRRQYLKQHNLTGVSMLAILPEYVVPHTVHLLSHDPDFITPKDLEALKDIKECLWFVMEPLVTKPESVGFVRKMLQTIKQMKDAQAVQEKQTANKKLYAVCEVGLGLLTTKLPGMVVKDHPGDILLPTRLFVKPKRPVNPRDSYLPKKLQQEFSQVAENNTSSSESQEKEEKAADKKKAGKGTTNNKKKSGDENLSPMGKENKAAEKKGVNSRKVLTQKEVNDLNKSKRSGRSLRGQSGSSAPQDAPASPSRKPLASPPSLKSPKPKTKQTLLNKYVTPKQKAGGSALSTPVSSGGVDSASEAVSSPSPVKRKKIAITDGSPMVVTKNSTASNKKTSGKGTPTKNVNTGKGTPTNSTAGGEKGSPKKGLKSSARGVKALLNVRDKGEKKMVRTNKVATIKRTVKAVSRTRAGTPQKRVASTPLETSPVKRSKASPSKESPLKDTTKAAKSLESPVKTSPVKPSPVKGKAAATKKAPKSKPVSKASQSKVAPSPSPKKSEKSPAKTVKETLEKKASNSSPARTTRRGRPRAPTPSPASSPAPSPAKTPKSPTKKPLASPVKRASTKEDSRPSSRGRQPIKKGGSRAPSKSPAGVGSSDSSGPEPTKRGRKAVNREEQRVSSSRSTRGHKPAKLPGRVVPSPRKSSPSPSASPSPSPSKRKAASPTKSAKSPVKKTSKKAVAVPAKKNTKKTVASPVKKAIPSPAKKVISSPAKKTVPSPTKNVRKGKHSPVVPLSTRSTRSGKRKITPARRFSPSRDETISGSPSKSPTKSKSPSRSPVKPKSASRSPAKSPSKSPTKSPAKTRKPAPKSPPKVRRVANKMELPNVRVAKGKASPAKKTTSPAKKPQSPATKKIVPKSRSKAPTKETVKRKLVDSESEVASSPRSSARSISSAGSSPQKSPSPRKTSSPQRSPSPRKGLSPQKAASPRKSPSLAKASPKKNVRQAANTRNMKKAPTRQAADKKQGKDSATKRKGVSRTPTPSPKKRKIDTPTRSPSKSSPEKSTLNISRKSHRRRKSKP